MRPFVPLDMCRFAARCGVPQAPFCTPGQSVLSLKVRTRTGFPISSRRWRGATGTFLYAQAASPGASGTWPVRPGGSAAGKARPLYHKRAYLIFFPAISFMSICAAMRHSICGLAPTRYARLHFARLARYVPLRATLWGATGTFLCAHSEQVGILLDFPAMCFR